jgi:hypothetical protein
MSQAQRQSGTASEIKAIGEGLLSNEAQQVPHLLGGGFPMNRV